MAESEFLLEMKNISKEFPGVKALDDVTIQVRPGSVHCLMGENGAGKSTLMKCLFGLYVRDTGEILLEGKPVDFKDTRDALRNGVTMIHQELYPQYFLSVKENVYLGRLPIKFKIGPLKFVDFRKLTKDTQAVLDNLSLNLDPNRLVRYYSVSQIQSMEIAKAVSYGAKVIIMDEPTSSLTITETENLFKIINLLREQGVSIIYITHKIEEVLRICDYTTIMRDGAVIGTWPHDKLSNDMIINNMVGRELTNRFPPRTAKPSVDKVALRVTNITSANPRSFKNVTFDLMEGEILGLGGLVGSQRTEIVESLFGLRAIAEGTVEVYGEKTNIRSPRQAIEKRFALLTEERRATGIFPILSVFENIEIANRRKYTNKLGFIDRKRSRAEAQEMFDRLNVKAPSMNTRMLNLSGGNQQKALFARWLLTAPDIMLLDEPTRGIDVGAKYEIYKMIMDLAEQGKSIIMISSEMVELIGVCDRVIVMCAGRKSGELLKEEITEQNIMRLAVQFM